MDGDDAPSALDAELLEEGGGYNPFGGSEAVRVEEGATDDGDEDYGEAAAEDLGGYKGSRVRRWVCSMQRGLDGRGVLQYPIVVPPAIAPKLATTWVTVTALWEKSNWFSNI